MRTYGKNVLKRITAVTISLIFILSFAFNSDIPRINADEIEYITFDLSKDKIVIGADGYIGKNNEGTVISGMHSDTNKYLIMQSSKAEPTENNIRIDCGNTLSIFDITIDDINCNTAINREIGSVNTNNSNIGGGISAACTNGGMKLTLRLKGTNKVGRFHYSTDNVSGGSSLSGNCQSSLTITSSDGDGSSNGTLYAVSNNLWAAAIGGSDSIQHTRNITIKGGTINAIGKCSSAIGGGGNGHSNITITGGIITAENYGTGATIGGGGGDNQEGGSSIINITNGNITATNHCNGNNHDGVAIGAGGSRINIGAHTSEINISGGIISAFNSYEKTGIGGGSSTSSIAGGSSVYISGGTIITSGMGSGNNYSGYPDITSIRITGGSVNTTNITHQPTGSDGTPVSLKILKSDKGANTKINSLYWIPNTFIYGMNDVYTDSESNLYIWHPSGNTVSAVDNSTATPIAYIEHSSNICGSLMTAVLQNGNATSYQWQISNDMQNWSNLSGENTNTYTTKSNQGNKNIRVIINSIYTSQAVTIQNISAAKPTATINRTGSAEYGSKNNMLTCSVAIEKPEDYTLSYQWIFGNITKETTDSSYRIPSDLAAGTYEYYCKVTATRTDNNLFNIDQAEISVIITQRNITVSSDKQFSYDGLEHSANANITSGTLADGNTLECSYEALTSVGNTNSITSLAIKDSKHNNVTANYNITSSGTLRIMNAFTTAAANSFNKLDVGAGSTVSIAANKEFTVRLDWQYTPYQNNTIALEFTSPLPNGTSIILVDYSEAQPIYYYCNLTAAATTVNLTSFCKMGTLTPFIAESGNESKTKTYQFTFRFPENNTQTVSDAVCRLTQGGNDTGIGFKYTLTQANIPDAVLNVSDIQTNTNNIDIPLNFSTTENGNRMLALSLFNSDNVSVNITNYTSVRLNNLIPEIISGNTAVFSIESNSGTYTAHFDNLPTGSYKIKTSLCLTDSITPYFMSECVSCITKEITINQQSAYELTAELKPENSRIVNENSTLELNLAYKINNAFVQSVTPAAQIFSKIDNTYTALAEQWTVTGLSAIALTDGRANGTASDISVTVPTGTPAGTYRIVFTLGDAEINYNFIVQ